MARSGTRTVRAAMLAGVALLALELLAASAAHAQASAYVIGNSLTNDMVPDGVQALASGAGPPASVGFHIRSGSSLTYIVAHPADVTYSRGGDWPDALAASRWDAVTMQPYLGAGSTLASEGTAILTLVDQARRGVNATTKFYVYAAWPSVTDTGGQYEAYWRQRVSSDAAQPTVLAAAYFDALLARLRRDAPAGVVIDLIPVGEVLAQIDRRLRAGEQPGIRDVTDLYRDADHMGDVGRYAAAVTVYMKVWGRRPASDAVLAIYQQGLGSVRLTPELARWVEDVAWNTVNRKTTTGGSTGGGGATTLSWLTLSLLLGRSAWRRRQR